MFQRVIFVHFCCTYWINSLENIPIDVLSSQGFWCHDKKKKQFYRVWGLVTASTLHVPYYCMCVVKLMLSACGLIEWLSFVTFRWFPLYFSHQCNLIAFVDIYRVLWCTVCIYKLLHWAKQLQVCDASRWSLVQKTSECQLMWQLSGNSQGIHRKSGMCQENCCYYQLHIWDNIIVLHHGMVDCKSSDALHCVIVL